MPSLVKCNILLVSGNTTLNKIEVSFNNEYWIRVKSYEAELCVLTGSNLRNDNEESRLQDDTVGA